MEILTDESARKAYDKVLRARKEAVIRNQQLDGKRRKLKEDLEKRERLAGESRKYGKQKSDEELLRVCFPQGYVPPPFITGFYVRKK